MSGVKESKGCGSAMRTAPIGLYYHDDEARLIEVAKASSLPTHGHPTALAAAVGTAYLTALALRGEPPESYVEKLARTTEDIDGDFVQCIRKVPAALEMEDEEEHRKHVAELKRKNRLAELLARGEELAHESKWKDARELYLEALTLARAGEKKEIKDKVRAAEQEISYAEAIGRSRDAMEKKAWKEVISNTQAALAIKPGDEAAQALVDRAKKALGPEKLIRNSIGMELALVPAGEFTMGSGDGDPDETPVHKVHLDAYYIGKHEVTNAQFELFSPAHKEKRKQFSLGDDMPVIAITWDEAMAFCRWLTQKEGVECRLPTEAEWEKAARGTDERVYPWGNELPGEADEWRCNFAPAKARDEWKRDGFEFASPIGSFPKGASPYVCLDMAGNTWEWCLDWYYDTWYGSSSGKDPKGPGQGTKRVIRGGSFTNGAKVLRSANRAAKPPNYCEASIGFRCVRAVRSEEEAPGQ